MKTTVAMGMAVVALSVFLLATWWTSENRDYFTVSYPSEQKVQMQLISGWINLHYHKDYLCPLLAVEGHPSKVSRIKISGYNEVQRKGDPPALRASCPLCVGE